MKFLRISILTALHVCLIFLHTSCIREEMNACVQYKLNTQAVDEQGNDLTGNGILEKSEVYLFGEKGFIRMIPAKASLDYGQVGGGYEYVVLISYIDWQDALIVKECGQGIFFISSFYTIS